MNNEDNELIYMIRQNDLYAFKTLYEKYYRLIMKFVAEVKRNCKNIEYEEVKQILSINFYSSLESFNEQKGNFFSYLFICVQRSAYNITREYFALRDGLNYQNLSLDEILDSDGNITRNDMIYDESSPLDPKYILMVKELEEKYAFTKINLLSRQENIIFSLLEKGKSYTEIAKLLNLNKKQIYNSIERIKAKIKNILVR